MQNDNPPGTNSYTFSWSYTPEFFAAVANELDQLKSSNALNEEELASHSRLGYIAIAACWGIGVILAAYWINELPRDRIPIFVVMLPFFFSIVIALKIRSDRKLPEKARRINKERGEITFSLFGDSTFKATITPDRVCVHSDELSISCDWSMCSGLIFIPSAILIVGTHSERLLWLPRTAVFPELSRSDDGKLLAELTQSLEDNIRRWFDHGQYKRVHRTLQSVPVFCPECRYNLKGITELKCPECGRPLKPDDFFAFQLQ